MEKVTVTSLKKFIDESEIKLKCTQPKLCVPIIDRLYRKMKVHILFADIKVDGDWICNGHHRYLASLLAKVPIGITIGLKTTGNSVKDWKLIEYDVYDWDTSEDIDKYDREDAEFSGLSLNQLLDLLK